MLLVRNRNVSLMLLKTLFELSHLNIQLKESGPTKTLNYVSSKITDFKFLCWNYYEPSI